MPTQYFTVLYALVHESVNLDKRQWSMIIAVFLFIVSFFLSAFVVIPN
jgi:hypothetical protein